MTALSASERATLLRLARASIADRALDPGSLDRALEESRLTPALQEIRGSFVTLHESPRPPAEPVGRLRGCIGTVEPCEALARSVIRNAAHAAYDDPRFPPVGAGELPGLRIEISALTPLRPIGDPSEIVVGRDGVELMRGSRRSVFLPQVALEQRWDVTQLLEQLAVKAGLPRDGWRGAELRIFEAEVFGELDGSARDASADRRS